MFTRLIFRAEAHKAMFVPYRAVKSQAGWNNGYFRIQNEQTPELTPVDEPTNAQRRGLASRIGWQHTECIPYLKQPCTAY